MKARVTISLKSGVLDPQGKAIAGALHGLGFSSVGTVRQGKVIDIDLPDATSEDEARKQIGEMCEKLLANPVMETYSIEILSA